MTLESWKKEFYRTTAKQLFERRVNDKVLVLHALRKWRGLTEENLRKHGLFKSSRNIAERDYPAKFLSISDKTCGLCLKFVQFKIFLPRCEICPINLSRKACCDECLISEDDSPYRMFLIRDDPEPMIKVLENTLKWLELQK